MRRLLAGALAIGVVGTAGGFGTGVSLADPAFPPNPNPSPIGVGSDAQVVYALGGARAPGIPWRDYTMRAGTGYYPTAAHDVIDYPAGAPFSWVPSMFLPAGNPPDKVTIGVAAEDATNNLTKAIKSGNAPAAAVGLSQGNLGIDSVQARLVNDPKAPPPDKLQFTSFGDPTGHTGFGKSFLRGLFPPGSYIPIIDYTMPKEVDDQTQYDTNKVFAAYDGLADFPDRPTNLVAVANATFGAAIGHTPSAFTTPEDVPAQNRRTFTNAKGATTTTYMIPVDHLPLTVGLRYLGMSDGFVNQIDSVLQPMVDAGYSYNDDPATRPTGVDPVNGMNPLALVDGGTRGGIEDVFAQVRGFLPPLP
ncbi:PE-PPE domain-containing protein [Mycolicibacterium sp.]|uniref:PE-PPE domain-containing protein n=1 Tax=Mycolicibacterium sp. TaxID=2320850 RepID=UPI001A33FC9B|nr:PE-PPE domain-containing protein [Mycolicibacterium sp.]MBJ7340148.1 PE-PPE domain-containing protein [Mycolicibacterium sp.]